LHLHRGQLHLQREKFSGVIKSGCGLRFLELGTRMSPEPAGWKACATSGADILVCRFGRLSSRPSLTTFDHNQIFRSLRICRGSYFSGCMIPRLLALLALLSITAAHRIQAETNANRLTYLDEPDPFNVGLNFPKLTTPL